MTIIYLRHKKSCLVTTCIYYHKIPLLVTTFIFVTKYLSLNLYNEACLRRNFRLTFSVEGSRSTLSIVVKSRLQFLNLYLFSLDYMVYAEGHSEIKMAEI